MAQGTTSCRLALASVLPLLQKHGLSRPGPASSVALEQGMSGELRLDSRQVLPGDLFLAYRGVKVDGHQYIAKACANGARVIIGDDVVQLAAAAAASAAAHQQVQFFAVTDARAAWAYLAASAHGEPQLQLQLLGVTGTNGKTSTVWMTAELLRASGIACLSIGTLGAYFSAEERVATSHTTPDPDVLYALLAEAVRRDIKVVAMEVSSHAISQGKLGPLRFAATAFTSFSRDHLDFHPSLADYWQAKWQLFSRLAKPNARHCFAASLSRVPDLTLLSGERLVYGEGASAVAQLWGADGYLDVKTEKTNLNGSILQLHSAIHDQITDRQLTVPYFAAHATDNYIAASLLAETAAGRFLAPPAAALRCVPGRLEAVSVDAVPVSAASLPTATAQSLPAVFVDYAHTPDALCKTLTILRPLTTGRLSVVFGCGGDRDRGKRPLMGEAAERVADRVYLTSDNPRSEDPEAILTAILAGCRAPQNIVCTLDRDVAIARAIAEAGPDDLVLIAGKGHETEQIFATCSVPFDDRLVAGRYLREKLARSSAAPRSST